jgi:hypothetical protein
VAFICPLHETSTSQQFAPEIALQRLRTVCSHKNEYNIMTNFGLIGAAAIALLAATPVMAAQVRHHHRYGYARRLAPAQNPGQSWFRRTDGAYEYYGIDKYYPEENYDADFDRKNTFS